MRIRFLGTHNEESRSTKLVSLLIDDVLAIDAGSFVSELSFAEQKRVRAILLSHGHYDHIKAITTFAFNNAHRTTKVFATRQTLDILVSHLVDGLIFPNFTERNSFMDKPALELCCLEVFNPVDIEGYQVTAFPLNHPIETVGFAISSGSQQAAKTLLYVTDTGPGLSELWACVSPQLLIVDTTYPNRLEKAAWAAGHLCPQMLAKELTDFRRVKGYLPKVVLIHLSPRFEGEIREEVQRLGEELQVPIEMANEGDRIDI